jgi:hypothetical protein
VWQPLFAVALALLFHASQKLEKAEVFRFAGG